MNLEKLNQVIKDSGLKKSYIAKSLSIDRSSLSIKLKGKRKFSIEEATQLSQLLRVPLETLVNGTSTNN